MQEIEIHFAKAPTSTEMLALNLHDISLEIPIFPRMRMTVSVGDIPANQFYNATMRPLLLLALMLATTSFAQTSLPTTTEIQTQEEHVWAIIAAGDFSTLHSLFLPDYLNVEEHILNREDTIAFLRQCKVDRYKISDLQMRPLGPDSALSVYSVKNTFTCTIGGKAQTMDFDSHASSVWVRHKDASTPNAPAQWHLQAHFETPAAKS
jgi:hypothetical protein